MTERNTSKLSLYQYDFCPYCLIVRRAIKRLGIDIEIRDTLKHPEYRQELIESGGKSQVPCLRIEKNGSVLWMYESAEIIDYLNRHFGQN